MPKKRDKRRDMHRITVHNMVDGGAFVTDEKYTPAQTDEIQRMLKLIARRVTGLFDPDLVDEVNVTRRGEKKGRTARC